MVGVASRCEDASLAGPEEPVHMNAAEYCKILEENLSYRFIFRARYSKTESQSYTGLASKHRLSKSI